MPSTARRTRSASGSRAPSSRSGTARGALSNEQASTQLRDLIQARVTHDLGPRDAELTVRLEVVSSMLIGVVVGRRIVHVDALGGRDRGVKGSQARPLPESCRAWLYLLGVVTPVALSGPESGAT